MSPAHSYTDDDLRRAIASSRSLREVMGTLGLSPTGGGSTSVHRHAARLGLTLPLAHPGGRTWEDTDLRNAVVGATSLKQVAERLGLAPNGRGNKVLRAHAARLGLTLPNGWYRNRADGPAPQLGDMTVMPCPGGRAPKGPAASRVVGGGREGG